VSLETGESGVSISSINYDKNAYPNDLSIPASLNGKDVVRLGHRSFNKVDFSNSILDESTGVNMVFPDTLVEVGKNAFSNTKIASVIVPKCCKYVKESEGESFPSCCKVIIK
jgi:hypothetical protein